MNDAGAMRSRKRARRLNRDVEDSAELHRLASQSMAQRLTIDILRGDEIHLVDLLDLVNRDDVGMVERGGSLGFLNEPAHAIAICGDVVRKNLQRDVAI